MKHKVLFGITACLIAALGVMGAVYISMQIRANHTAARLAAASAAAASAKAAQAQQVSNGDRQGTQADSSGSQSPSADQGQEAGTGLYNLSGGEVTKTDEALQAAADDQSTVIVSGGSVLTMSGMKIGSSGNTSSVDSSSFYGLNAAVLAKTGSTIKLSDSTVTTTGTGANGVFSTGADATVELDAVTIDCKASGAHGVEATQGGILRLTGVNISTAGDGAAAGIATDRGGGTITVNGGSVLTTGTKSPAIYSTGSVTATGTVMKATGSEAVVIEGKNSVTLANCSLTAGKNDGVFIYQSMSGDADTGSGSFTMTDGSLTASEGPLFYSTNTTAVIHLKNVTLSGTGVLLKAAADQWGNAGSNGAQVTLNADTQKLAGEVAADSISSADLNLQNGSSLNGAINSAKTAKSAALSLDKTSTWNVTADSYLSALTDADSTLANITGNGHTVYYDRGNSANAWLGGKSAPLAGGGMLKPMQ